MKVTYENVKVPPEITTAHDVIAWATGRGTGTLFIVPSPDLKTVTVTVADETSTFNPPDGSEA